MFIFMDAVGRRSALNNLAEDTVVHRPGTKKES
jgi:hypothetical protein